MARATPTAMRFGIQYISEMRGINQRKSRVIIVIILDQYTYYDTNDTHTHHDIACTDTIETERALSIEVLYSQKETDDKSQIISDEKSFRGTVISEMFTKSSNICRDEEGDGNLKES